MKTDTPRTDAIQFQKKPISLSIENEMLRSLSRQLERELAASQSEVEFWKAKAYEAEQSEGKHEAEVEHIKALLKDIPAVHTNTLRGNIATLSWDSYEHIIGPHPCRERAENAEAEVERLRDAFSHLTNEIECTPWCVSHDGGHCDCKRLKRAYAISDSIAQNPTK